MTPSLRKWLLTATVSTVSVIVAFYLFTFMVVSAVRWHAMVFAVLFAFFRKTVDTIRECRARLRNDERRVERHMLEALSWTGIIVGLLFACYRANGSFGFVIAAAVFLLTATLMTLIRDADDVVPAGWLVSVAGAQAAVVFLAITPWIK